MMMMKLPLARMWDFLKTITIGNTEHAIYALKYNMQWHCRCWSSKRDTKKCVRLPSVLRMMATLYGRNHMLYVLEHRETAQKRISWKRASRWNCGRLKPILCGKTQMFYNITKSGPRASIKKRLKAKDLRNLDVQKML